MNALHAQVLHRFPRVSLQDHDMRVMAAVKQRAVTRRSRASVRRDCGVRPVLSLAVGCHTGTSRLRRSSCPLYAPARAGKSHVDVHTHTLPLYHTHTP
jgi:hypothetical protein